MKKQYQIKTLQETNKLAEQIAENLSVGQVVTIKGTLGAGKTYFTHCLINALLNKDNQPTTNVISPTFNIVKEYKLNNFSIYHFDLYRLKNKNELYELDIENCFETGISIIEWPEIAENIIYNIAIEIEIKISGETEREFIVNCMKS
ncbi:MAG TPA: tRNA (adenosine(37)-N6)-threonylcarbamoyltransferase complex ATPase subunit type 1 TsaE [Rickettsiales bacterium]|nr:tRNA (adenosine(37)-N6)-threonylcarbamoyltransferase complex ATPase subunit type 1 TsaE [Rickettsiales bacterium]